MRATRSPPADARCGAGHQRERHRRDGRDPLRRQRPARGARRADGQRRLPGAALRRRWPVHRRPDARRRMPSTSPRSRGSHRRSRPWRAGRRRTSAPAAWRTKVQAAQDRRRGRLRTWRRRGPRAASAAAHRGRRALHLVPGRTATPVAARKQWIAGTLKPAGELVVDAGAAQALRAGQEPAAGRRRAAWAAASSVATRWWCAAPTGARWRAASPRMRARTRERICGRRSSELEGLLGYRGRDEIIHRDDLVLM